ncbi:MAG: VC_2705 family sodium/solute symporter [Gammaproteobacteria bacterium]
MSNPSARTLTRNLTKYYGYYTGGFISFVILLAIAEQLGLPNVWIGYIFMAATFGLYTLIGILSRTGDIAEYYVAGRRVPAIFNGMATAADWMSAASFIGLAGILYLSGFDGLAFVMGWSGGYVLVALLLAPYLRRFGQFTIPDFLGARYGGNFARGIGVVAAVLASFTYLVAQVYGIGLVSSRFLGIDFTTGVFVGLAGILVCSLLGGMKAITWTQVAQYVILIIAYLVPVVMLSQRITEVPIPQLMYGQVLQEVSEREREIFQDPGQLEAQALFRQKAEAIAARIAALPDSLEAARREAEQRLARLQADAADPLALAEAERALQELPRTADEAREKWRKALEQARAQAKPPAPHAQPFPGENQQERDTARLNFLALALCLMVGTASLPHILMRYYTTPSVREARDSVFWSLFFILLLYLTAPSLAVLAKFEVYNRIIGVAIADLPSWVTAWGKVGLLKIEDINGDGILQLAELTLNPDIIVLATPEIAGLPYVVSGLVAAGGLASALSTGDALLLTITSGLSHDVYYRMLDPDASTTRRMFISKVLLLVVAVIAAYVASLKPATILYMVAWAFSIAGSAFFPALVLGIFWKRANRAGAVAGMLVGLGLCLFYLIGVKFYGMTPWFGIKDISAGVFGIPAGFLTIIVVSLLTRAPDARMQELVDKVRCPPLR